MDTGIRRIFTDVAPTYDLVNRVLTLGLDPGWREQAARIAAGPGGLRYLDICSGTGDMARALRKHAARHALVVAADFCEPMLRQTAQKAAGCPLVLADAGELPFADASFDVVTISFATRNLHSSREMLVRRFAEFHRVLKPGGRFVNVETSQPPSKLIRWGYHAYVKLIVQPVGRLLSGSGGGYAYLAHTIPRFYDAAGLAEVMREAGFAAVDVKLLLCGAAAVHVAHKA